MKYPKLKTGEAQQLNLDEDDWMLACCDCGSVHLIQFHHIKDNIWDFVCSTQPRRSGQLRRHYFGLLQQDGKLNFCKTVSSKPKIALSPEFPNPPKRK